MNALTRTERDKLSDLRDDIAIGIRGSVEMDGEECHCRGDPLA